MKSSIVLIVCFGITLSSSTNYGNPDYQFSRVADAITRNDVRTVNDILAKYHFSINYINKDGDTLLNFAVAQDKLDFVNLLINRHGADINHRGGLKDGVKYSPLDTAAKYNLPNIAEFLIKRGAELPFNDGRHFKPKMSPLHWATMKGFDSLASVLIQHSRANVSEVIDDNGGTLLHYAVTLTPTEKSLSVAKLLIEHGANVNARNVAGRTPLHFTTHRGRAQFTKLLIDNNADMNQSDDDGKSPLHEAVKHEAIDVIKMLIKKGANLNLTTPAGQTALHIAATKNEDIAKLLVEAGIDVHIKDNSGKTAADLVANTTETAKFVKILNGNNALGLCANIILISFLVIGVIIARLQ